MSTPFGDEVEARMREMDEFNALDKDARQFVLKILCHEATDADWDRFNARPDAKSIAQWMMTLPGFGHMTEEDDAS